MHRPVPMLDPQTNYVSDKISELSDDLVDTIVAYYDAEEPDAPKPTREVKYTKEQLLETLRHHLSEDICLLSMKSHDAIISGYIRQHEEIEIDKKLYWGRYQRKQTRLKLQPTSQLKSRTKTRPSQNRAKARLLKPTTSSWRT